MFITTCKTIGDKRVIFETQLAWMNWKIHCVFDPINQILLADTGHENINELLCTNLSTNV